MFHFCSCNARRFCSCKPCISMLHCSQVMSLLVGRLWQCSTLTFAIIRHVCDSCTAAKYPEPVGWRLVAVLNTTATYGGSLRKIPTAAVLRPLRSNISRQLVVVIRGSAFNESRISEFET
jgi:hypothetical protein